MAMKKCKECGEEISSSAKVCPKCGKKQGSPVVTIIIVIVVILVIGAIASGGGTNNSNTLSTSSSSDTTSPISTTTTTTTEEASAPIEYTAIDVDTLEDALDNNAAAAKDTYNGKYLEIKGKLGTIDSDMKYISLLSLTDEWDFTGIHCTIKSDEQREIVKTLSKDQTLVVKGKITDVGEVLGYYLDITEIVK